MKIELVEGWQNQHQNIPAYQLGQKDRTVLDDVHDNLQINGKLYFLDEGAPIACPAFIVWRTVGEEQKGRVVIDMRPVNRLTTLTSIHYQINPI